MITEFKSIRVVCFGGGTGLPSVLRALKPNPWLELTAIVNMFDAGGSSGMLKDKFGILPPGDVLKCLLSLSENEPEARKILLRRISHLADPGHTGGNALLLGLEKLYGSFLDAIVALSEILSVQGTVLPVSLGHASMCAKYTDGRTHTSEIGVDIGIKEGKTIEHIFLEPKVEATQLALAAILQAHAIVIGPGSFYTSVLPNFLPIGIQAAIQQSRAPIFYVANLVTEGVGMRAMSLDMIVSCLETYVGRRSTAVVVNDQLPKRQILSEYAQEGKYPILLEKNSALCKTRTIITAPLWQEEIARHSTEHLGYLMSGLLNFVTH